MTYSTRRVYILVGLLLASSLIHAIVSWQVGRKIDGPERVLPPEEEVAQIVMEKPPEPEQKTPPRRAVGIWEELEFDLQFCWHLNRCASSSGRNCSVKAQSSSKA